MKSSSSKLGRTIVLTVSAIIIVTCTIIIILSIELCKNLNEKSLEASASVGVNVLKSDMDAEYKRIQTMHSMWNSESSVSAALESGNADILSKEFTDKSSDDYDFAVFVNNSGKEIWKSNSFKLASYDASSALSGKSGGGIFTDANVPLSYLYSAPIRSSDGRIVGACIVGFDLASNDYLDGVNTRTGNQATLFAGDTRYSTSVKNSDGSRATGTKMPENVKKTVIDNGEEYFGKADILGEEYFVCYRPLKNTNGEVIGAYFSGKPTAETNVALGRIIFIVIAAEVVCVIIAGFIMVSFVATRVGKPIAMADKLADDMSAGRFDNDDANYQFANDEVGAFANKLRETKRRLSSYIGDISDVLSSMAQGNFSKAPNVSYEGDFIRIQQSFENIHRTLSDIIKSIDTSSQEVLSGSNQMANGSQMLADGTTRQASAIEQLSATISDISVAIRQNADDASEARKLSENVENTVIAQNDEVSSMLTAMSEIENTSNEISKIIKTIDDIAFQTNILALNAAVEAARAGSAGKGFAVVADEVRNLASKSAEAANDTTKLISASIEAVNNGAKIAGSTAESMKKVMEISRETNELISRIYDATSTQATSISQVTQGIEQISVVVQQNSATAEETAASCQELTGQSKNLKEQVAILRV